jgi:2-polyprenyl-6-methoxyphenol hydroxylase-like FAD-dependent oxidoreductase
MSVKAETHAVVLGGGLAGMLAATVLAQCHDSVTIVDRDLLPADPTPRKGVPQARHAHLLWSGGARAIDSLLPGTTERLIAAGAHRVALPTAIVSMSAQGWFRRFPERQFLLSCSRDLLDWVVREQTLANTAIVVRGATDIIELLGDGTRVTGVKVKDQRTGEVSDLSAAFVVDATGRGSRAPTWLTGLGLPDVKEEIVDSGLAYASRFFRAPSAATAGFPVVNVQADPRAPHPGQTATLLPIEDAQWLVTLSGTRGGPPPIDEDGFIEFARSVRHPIVGDLIASAQPLGPVHSSRSTVNLRRYFERLGRWPEGFVVLGDAVATYNPVYGHGMSVAAHGAAALRHGLTSNSPSARRIQRAIARTVEPAWAMATGQDILYPEAIGRRPPAMARILQRYVERLTRTAISRPLVANALLDAFSLSGPMARLVAPNVIIATIFGPNSPAPDGPPLTTDELAMLDIR